PAQPYERQIRRRRDVQDSRKVSRLDCSSMGTGSEEDRWECEVSRRICCSALQGFRSSSFRETANRKVCPRRSMQAAFRQASESAQLENSRRGCVFIYWW